MRRDFSEKRKEDLLKKINSINDEGFWTGISSSLKLLCSILLSIITMGIYNYTKPLIDKYHAEICRKMQSLSADIRTIFKRAYEEDKKYAARGELLNGCGENLLRKLEMLTELAEPKGDISPILNGKRISDYEELMDETIIISKIPGISDEDLIKFSADLNNKDWRQLLINTTGALAEMGIGTALLISLFKHKEVNMANILHTPGYDQLKKNTRENILSGKSGYASVAEFAKAAGVSEEAARHYLRFGNLQRYYSTGKDRGQNGHASNSDIKARLEKQLDREIENALSDETVVENICKDLGVEPEYIKAAKNGDLSGYEIKCYQKAIGGALEDIADREEIEIYQEEFKKIIDGINKSKKLYMGEEKAAKMEEYMKNGIFSKAEAKEFLKEFCGIEKPSDSDVEILRNFTSLTDNLKNFGETLETMQNATDALAYWLADYDKELKLLESMKQVGCTDPNYLAALNELEKKYTDKFGTTLEGVAEAVVEKGVGVVKGGVPLLGLAETAIDLGGKATGVSGTADAAMDIVTLTSVCGNTTTAYEEALRAVREGDHSQEALSHVRTSFEIMKQTMTDYYDAQIEYAKGNFFELSKPKQILYYEYQKGIIENAQLGDDIEILTYEKYLAAYDQKAG